MHPKKKITVHSVAFACTMLAALFTGIWFLFPVKELLQEHSPELIQFWDSVPEQPHIPVVLPEISEEFPVIEVKELTEESEEATEEVATEEEEVQEQAQAAEECTLAAQTLERFFQTAATQPAVQRLQVKQGLEEHSAQLLALLIARPPQVGRETDELQTVIANIAHLYRVIGPQNIYLLQELAAHGQSQQEDLAAALYRQTVDTAACSVRPSLHFPLETAAQYAGFFLYTMGGRSYLFRRDAQTRLLLTYYAVLVLDQAQQEGIAVPVGDLSPIITNLQGEIEATQHLKHQEEYLKRLRELSSRFSPP